MRHFITRKLEWDSAHRVLRHESKCSTLHGHRYVAEITVSAEELDDVGRVVDFGVIKERVGSWIDDNFDHTTLVNAEDICLAEFCKHDMEQRAKRAPYLFTGEPTAENIAKELYHVARKLLLELSVENVRVFETPNCWADYGAVWREVDRPIDLSDHPLILVRPSD